MSVQLDYEASLESMTRLGEQMDARESLRADKEPITPAEDFGDREGYDAKFLDGFTVQLPAVKGARAKDVLQFSKSNRELKYTHFSVVMSKERRMPMFVAVNINGEKSRRIPRTNTTWAFDGRLDKSQQWGDALYDNNALDRGHMVRREDPIWDTMKIAEQANDDTFHFTNSCPQMAGVNQHIWLGLEDYILKHARADNMRVTVFTGPFFTEDDLPYRGALVPLSFWKVVAIVRDNGRPSVTAYKVSQERELAELEFVYAGYKTFQISVQQVIDDTGINFGSLVQYDGFSAHEKKTGQRLAERLERAEDIRI